MADDDKIIEESATATERLAEQILAAKKSARDFVDEFAKSISISAKLNKAMEDAFDKIEQARSNILQNTQRIIEKEELIQSLEADNLDLLKQQFQAVGELEEVKKRIAKSSGIIKAIDADIVNFGMEKTQLEKQLADISKKRADDILKKEAEIAKIQEEALYAQEDMSAIYAKAVAERAELEKMSISEVRISSRIAGLNEKIKNSVADQVVQQARKNQLLENAGVLEHNINAMEEQKKKNLKDIADETQNINKLRKENSGLEAAIKGLQIQVILLKGIELGYERFLALDKAAENFRRTTGFTNTQMAELRKNVEAVNKDFAGLGVNIENAYKAAQALTDVFGRTSLVTKDAIENIALMSANLGVVEADAAEALSIFQGMGGATQEVAMNTMMAGAALSEKTGVPFSKVMGDIAKSSGTTAMLLGTTPSKLMKAAIAARALGTDLNTLAAQQEKLLNYSDSINSELEVSALLGRSISFQRARQLAYEGKVEESAKATLDMVKQAGDFNEMNIYQRKALAAASGMELKDLTKMMAVEAQKNEIRTKGTPEQKKQLEMQEAELKKLRETNDLTKDNVLEENKKAIAQAKIQGIMTQINAMLDQMKTLIADIVEPIITPLAKVMIPLLKVVALLVKGIAIGFKFVLEPIVWIAEGIGSMVDGTASFGKSIDFVKDKFKDFSTGVVTSLQILGALASGLLIKKMFFGGENPKSILEMVKAPFDAVKNGAKNIMQRVTGKSPVADMIGPKLPDASKGITDTAKATERIPAGTGVKEFLTNLASGLKKMGDGKVLLGALNLIPASIGLVAMVPGFAGAKLLENINGEALNTALSSLAEGLKKMAGTQVLKGALNLIPASIGLVAMIPGFVGIKLLENINGKALNAALSSLAEGLKSMSSGSVAKGAIVMTLASLGFVGMTVGAIGLGAVALLGEAAGAGLVGLSVGLAALSGAGLGVLVLLGISAAFVGFGFAAKLAADAFVSIAKVIPDTIKPLTSLALISPLLYIAAGGIGAVAMAFGTMGLAAPGMLIAGAAIALISISISSISAATESAVKNIPNLAESLTKLAVVSPALYAASSGLIALAGALGLMATVTIPATAASISIYLIAKSVEKLGTSFEQVSKNTISLAKSIPAVVNPIKQFASINMKETSEGMMMLSNSLASFGVGSAVAGIGSFIGNFLGGDPIAKMEKLASISDRLKDAASAISQIATATSRFSAVDSFAKSVGVLADSLNKLTDSLGNIKTEELAKLSTIAGATGATTEAAPSATSISTEGMESKLDRLTELLVGGAVKVYIDGKLVSSAIANTAGR